MLLADEYLEHLETKISFLDRIYQNTVDQTIAIEKKDDKALGKLINQREKLIKKILDIKNNRKQLEKEEEKTPMIFEMEKKISTLFGEIEKINNVNIQKAESLKDEYGNSVKRLRLGENAIKNGYFKREVQQYGYFIDKKIGR